MKKFQVFACILVFLIGLGLVLYPYISDYVNKMAASNVVSQQQNTVQNTSADKLAAALAAAQDYNAKLATARTALTDPFADVTTSDSDKEYNSLLNLNNDGVMGSIIIPAIGVNLPIYHGTSDEVLQKGVGHVENSSLPVGGASTHVVLAGHNGIPSMQIFDRLGELKVGDYFIIKVLNQELAYRVTSTEVVLPEDVDSLAIQPGKDLVTLVTCTPYGVNTHRLLVHAERCDIPQDWLDRQKRNDPVTQQSSSLLMNTILPLTLLGIAIAAAILLIARCLRRRRARRLGVEPATLPLFPFLVLPRRKKDKDEDDDGDGPGSEGESGGDDASGAGSESGAGEGKAGAAKAGSGADSDASADADAAPDKPAAGEDAAPDKPAVGDADAAPDTDKK